jgi:mediator of RNA polymerase II transcription subunit 16
MSDSNYSFNKKVRFSQEFLLAIDQSFTGSVIVGITNFCRLAVIRQNAFNSTIPPQIQTNYLMDMLDYCLVTGYDYWDLLVSAQPKQIDTLIER